MRNTNEIHERLFGTINPDILPFEHVRKMALDAVEAGDWDAAFYLSNRLKDRQEPELLPACAGELKTQPMAEVAEAIGAEVVVVNAKRTYKCSVCRETGHNKAKCPTISRPPMARRETRANLKERLLTAESIQTEIVECLQAISHRALDGQRETGKHSPEFSLHLIHSLCAEALSFIGGE